jgi:hypothetical protein
MLTLYFFAELLLHHIRLLVTKLSIGEPPTSLLSLQIGVPGSLHYQLSSYEQEMRVLLAG